MTFYSSFTYSIILISLLYIIITIDAIPFSGVYLPDISDAFETYAGSWLVPLTRFMSAKNFILYGYDNNVQNLDRYKNELEGGSFGMLFTGSHINIMTRDYFDLFVIHLSSTTNTLPDTDTPHKAIEKELLNRMKMTVKHLKNKAMSVEAASSSKHATNTHSNNERWQEETVALIIFSTQSVSTKHNTFNINIRKLYFKATFYSLYKYYKYIVVATINNNDMLIIQNMKLPVWKLVNVMPTKSVIYTNIHVQLYTYFMCKSILYAYDSVYIYYVYYLSIIAFASFYKYTHYLLYSYTIVHYYYYYLNIHYTYIGR